MHEALQDTLVIDTDTDVRAAHILKIACCGVLIIALTSHHQ
jgi:hypothetical protein